MKREPIYDKETRTLYGLNPMELDALKQRFSMRASPQEDSLDPASSKEDDAAPEQDDVPGQEMQVARRGLALAQGRVLV